VQQKWSIHQGLASAVAKHLRHAPGTFHAPDVLQQLSSLLQAALMLPTRRSCGDDAGLVPAKTQPGIWQMSLLHLSMLLTVFCLDAGLC